MVTALAITVCVLLGLGLMFGLALLVAAVIRFGQRRG